MDFALIIEALKAMNPRPKVVNLHSDNPQVLAIENYINWAIYNNEASLTTLTNVAIDAKNAYDTKKKEEFAATLQPPQEF